VIRRGGHMQRRGSSRQLAKRRRTTKSKARRAPISLASADHSAEQFDDLKRERDETLEQLAATSEVLRVISRSPTDIQPVLDVILQTAGRLCEAEYACFFKLQDGKYHLAGSNKANADYIKYLSEHPLALDRGTLVGRTALERSTVHIPDCLADREYTAHEYARIGKHRSLLGVPLLRDGVVVGVIALLRNLVKPYTDKQVELVTSFADQAMIAIENVRLFDEVQTRTRDLSELLEQQTATSKVLGVISSSPTDVQPVFDTIANNAVNLCGAGYCIVYSFDGEMIDVVAHYNLDRIALDALRQIWPMAPNPRALVGRSILEREILHVADVAAEPNYTFANTSQAVLGIRTFLGVPMLRGGQPIGAIGLYRREVKPFSVRQIELVKAFADQAVIAIGNVRLFETEQQRTRELSESLQQQTATADVLKIISRSTFDLKTVLSTLVESAVRLCEADMGNIARPKENDVYRIEASYGQSAALTDELTRATLKIGKGSVIGRTALNRAIVHIVDVRKDQDYELHTALKIGGYRTMLGVPLLREGNLVGVFGLARYTVRPFTDKQIELVTTFADQAVIAIENARLLSELRESLQQQTTTADVLKVISRSAFDLQTVLDALIESATHMCDADQGAITREIDGAFFRAASYGYSSKLSDFIRNTPVQLDRSSIAGRALVEGRIVQIPDVKADAEYTFSPGLDLGDFHTALGVPMLREGMPIGVLALTRKEVRPFTDKQIELITTFADQAAIAIENVRLFKSVEARTRELAASLENLRATQDRLVQTQKLASLGQLTAGIAHEIKNPLNFVNNFSAVSSELIDELQETLKGASFDESTRAEIKELTDTLRSNLDKVLQHGKRADAIVKNMLLHSRQGSGEHRLVDVNALVEESLNLAYHGARAEKQGFEIRLERWLDPTVGEADVFPQDITRVLLNLISNGFYAATKRRSETDGGDYEPTLSAATKNRGDSVEISIRDNGTGIPPDVKDKIFNPFFTTKPAGDGTGLGLSISHDIVVKQHGGSIEVDTQPGEFTEIRIILPRVAVPT
jgi:two-component system, NtrC family, sensor kinase